MILTLEQETKKRKLAERYRPSLRRETDSAREGGRLETPPFLLCDYCQHNTVTQSPVATQPRSVKEQDIERTIANLVYGQ
jgi:hypothetical protein